MGRAVGEVAAASCPVPIERIGVKNVFGESGRYEELMKKYELTAQDIVRAAKRVLQRKTI